MVGAWQLWVGPTYPAGAPGLRGWLEAIRLVAAQGSCPPPVSAAQNGAPGRGQNPGSGASGGMLCPALSHEGATPTSPGTLATDPVALALCVRKLPASGLTSVPSGTLPHLSSPPFSH